jgi:LytS/YehU family sensor histidine kinase
MIKTTKNPRSLLIMESSKLNLAEIFIGTMVISLGILSLYEVLSGNKNAKGKEAKKEKDRAFKRSSKTVSVNKTNNEKMKILVAEILEDEDNLPALVLRLGAALGSFLAIPSDVSIVGVNIGIKNSATVSFGVLNSVALISTALSAVILGLSYQLLLLLFILYTSLN